MQHKNEAYFERIEAFVNAYKEEHGISPTNDEVAEMLGVSKTTAFRYIVDMRDRGILDFSGQRNIITKATKQMYSTMNVPVLGSIACGIPKFAVENIEEYVRLPVSLFGKGCFFLLRADGQSMIDAGINSGDLVLIRQQEAADEGQIVVALVDDETATLKRYHPRPQKHCIILSPENKEFDDQVVDLETHTFSIQGVAVKVIKELD